MALAPLARIGAEQSRQSDVLDRDSGAVQQELESLSEQIEIDRIRRTAAETRRSRLLARCVFVLMLALVVFLVGRALDGFMTPILGHMFGGG